MDKKEASAEILKSAWPKYTYFKLCKIAEIGEHIFLYAQ